MHTRITTLDYFQGRHFHSLKTSRRRVDQKMMPLLRTGLQFGEAAASFFPEQEHFTWTLHQTSASLKISQTVFHYRKTPDTLTSLVHDMGKTVGIVKELAQDESPRTSLKKTDAL